MELFGGMPAEVIGSAETEGAEPSEPSEVSSLRGILLAPNVGHRARGNEEEGMLQQPASLLHIGQSSIAQFTVQ